MDLKAIQPDTTGDPCPKCDPGTIKMDFAVRNTCL